MPRLDLSVPSLLPPPPYHPFSASRQQYRFSLLPQQPAAAALSGYKTWSKALDSDFLIFAQPVTPRSLLLIRRRQWWWSLKAREGRGQTAVGGIFGDLLLFIVK